jgi:hypothetical protein
MGAELAEKTVENQKAFQEAVISGAKSIDCAAGFSIGANFMRSDNAKVKGSKAELLRVLSPLSKEYNDCYKFGIYGAYAGYDTEITLQRLLEKVGWIN